jgi:transposase
MGNHKTVITKITAKSRRKRKTLEGIQRCAQRDLVDPAYGGSLARPSGSISAIPNLPPPIPVMGTKWDYGIYPESYCQRLETPWGSGFEGMFHRRDLCSGKKGGPGVGNTKRGKGTKIMAMADRTGLPVAVCLESANRHEVVLVEDTIAHRFVKEKPQKLIGDKAYDSDELDEKLEPKGIEMISPHRENRKRAKTQDGRKLRRYKRRWKIERFFAWVYNFRRIVVRWEYHLENYLGFIQLACIIILLRAYL